MTQPLTDEQQTTLDRPATVRGLGLFTGAPATATFRPAPAGSGIRFRRTDMPGAPEIPALVDYVEARPRRTALKRGGASVETVEHCLSALAGLGIDNVTIDVDAPEVPAGDGSARDFAVALRDAGTRSLDEPRARVEVTEPLTVRDGDAVLVALPPTRPATTEYIYVLDYGPGSPIPRQVHSFVQDPEGYASTIAPARTFSTESDARAAWDAGLFRHLTPRDMLVIGDAGPIENTLRFDDEPVRHKLLDLMGDLSLVGRPIHARLVATKSGHALNHEMARRLRALALRADEGLPAVKDPAMDIKSILRVLPHRYPMVLVDRVLEIEGDTRAVGIKNVTINEPFFQGHYPAAPIMPGVLIVEAMCQLAGLMLSHKLERTGKVAMLLSLDAVKLRRAVTPGDQLVIETNTIRAGARYGDVQARAFVAGELAAEARVKFMMIDAEKRG